MHTPVLQALVEPDDFHLLQEAQRLARRPYRVCFAQTESATGTPIYLAYHPEFEIAGTSSCIAEGYTRSEARRALDEARIKHIQDLLHDGLPVPDPDMSIHLYPSARDDCLEQP
jgi:predicted RNase H-like HicB family nuclease